MDKRRTLKAALALVAGLGVGCAAPGGGPAPVIDRSTAAPGAPSEHIVQRGDSLYAIAWRHRLDYKAIARLNGIGPPYTIYPGQRLKLAGEGQVRLVAPTAAERPQVPSRSKPAAAKTENQAARAPRPATVGTPNPSVRAPSPPARAAEPSPRKPAAPPPAPPAERTAKAPTPAASGDGRWRWPVNAKPDRGFGRGNNGFDYTVPQGRGVSAAAPGVVVYSGPGLGGYKHLVIVEHGGGYLSAYSINATPQVSEGGAVPAGARLAEMSGANAVARRLHFEIRRNGAPVDPSRVIGR